VRHRLVLAVIHLRLSAPLVILDAIIIIRMLRRQMFAFFGSARLLSHFLGIVIDSRWLVFRFVRFPFVCCGAFNVCNKVPLELFVGHVSCCLDFLCFTELTLLNFDFINNVKSTAVVSLEVSPAQLKDVALFFNLCKETVTDLRQNFPGLDLFQMGCDFFTKCHSVFPFAHDLFNVLYVFLRSAILVLFDQDNVCAAVVLPHMLNEIGAVSNELTFQSINEWTSPLIETISAAHLITKK